jgi:ribonuclease J
MFVYTLGGYEEVGKNMTAIEVDGEVIIIDMGLRIDRMMIHEDTNLQELSEHELIRIGALPDDSMLAGKKVVAILLSHGHLDHIGGVEKMAHKYDCPIIGRPFTTHIVKNKLRYEEMDISRITTVQEGRVSDFKFEFVDITHSIPDSSLLALHTREGTILYANDFKLDNTPVLGKAPDYSRIKGLHPRLLIVESTRVTEHTKTPSEAMARFMLHNYFFDPNCDCNAMIVTTFSSHIARLKTLVEIAEKIGREPIMLGRSLNEYWGAARELSYVSKAVQTVRKKEAVDGVLKDVLKKKKDYFIIATGHQGESGSVLTRIADKKTPFQFEKNDTIIFSAKTIPNPINVASRYALETKLRMAGARLILDLHVSGHASREDHRTLLRLTNPELIIPSHGNFQMLADYSNLAKEEGYEVGEDVIITKNQQKTEI